MSDFLDDDTTKRLLDSLIDDDDDSEHKAAHIAGLAGIADAVGAIQAPDIKPVAAAVTGLAKVIASLGGTPDAIDDLCKSVSSIADAVKSIRAMDAGAITKSLDANTAATLALVAVMSRDKLFIFEGDDIVGTRLRK